MPFIELTLDRPGGRITVGIVEVTDAAVLTALKAACRPQTPTAPYAIKEVPVMSVKSLNDLIRYDTSWGSGLADAVKQRLPAAQIAQVRAKVFASGLLTEEEQALLFPVDWSQETNPPT